MLFHRRDLLWIGSAVRYSIFVHCVSRCSALDKITVLGSTVSRPWGGTTLFTVFFSFHKEHGDRTRGSSIKKHLYQQVEEQSELCDVSIQVGTWVCMSIFLGPLRSARVF